MTGWTKPPLTDLVDSGDYVLGDGATGTWLEFETPFGLDPVLHTAGGLRDPRILEACNAINLPALRRPRVSRGNRRPVGRQPGPGRERRISRGGGESPSRGAGDSELAFLADEHVVAASLRIDRSEPLDRLQPLFAMGPYWHRPAQVDYDGHPRDGRLLMVALGDGSRTVSRLNVVDGWFAGLEDLAGAEPR